MVLMYDRELSRLTLILYFSTQSPAENESVFTEQIEGCDIMRVTIFTDFDATLNPYILLFKKTLERQKLAVRFERNFNLNWLLSRGRSCDCIHLHWLHYAYIPPKKNDGSLIYKNLFKNRFVLAFLDILCLIEFVLTFLIAKLEGKIIVFTVHDLYEFEQKIFSKKTST